MMSNIDTFVSKEKNNFIYLISFFVLCFLLVQNIIMTYFFIENTKKDVILKTKLIKSFISVQNNNAKKLDIKQLKTYVPLVKRIETTNLKNMKKLKKNNQINFISFQKKQAYIFIPLNNKIIKIILDYSNTYNIFLKKIIILNIFELIFFFIFFVYLLKKIIPYFIIIEEVNKNIDFFLGKNNITQENGKNKIYHFNNLISLKKKYNFFFSLLNETYLIAMKKYQSLIKEVDFIKDKQNNTISPLKKIKESIIFFNSLFEFKKIIEEDETLNDIYSRIKELLISNGIHNFILIGIDNIDHKIILNKNTNEPYCNIVSNFKHCRAYRTKKIIDSTKIPKICTMHGNENYEYICIPILEDENLTYILKINIDKNKKEEIKRIKEIVPNLKVYLEEAASVLELKHTLILLKEKSIKDSLTGLFNRKYLDEIIPELKNIASEKKENIGILMLDMDKFKEINDTYGHKAGDLALQTIAYVIKKSIRKNDIAIRYGGEEFLIFLLNVKDKESLKKIAENIRTKMKDTEIKISDNKILHKTISIGGSLYSPDNESIWENIKEADKKLYQAKNEGRNKSII